MSSKLLAELQALDDVVDPPALRRFREMDQAIQAAVDSPALRGLLEVNKAILDVVDSPALRQMRQMREITSGFQSLDDAIGSSAAALAQSAQLRLADTATMEIVRHAAEMNELVEAASGRILFDAGAVQAARSAMEVVKASDAFASASRLQELVATLDNPFRTAVEAFENLETAAGLRQLDAGFRGLREALLPSIAGARLCERPVAILSALGVGPAASLVWNADETVRMALLDTPKPDESPNVVVHTSVRCHSCKRALLVTNTEWTLVGDESPRLDLDAVPLCTACLREDPASYVERMTKSPERPPLRLEVLDGGRSGPGDAIGQLRLVRNHDAAEDDD